MPKTYVKRLARGNRPVLHLVPDEHIHMLALGAIVAKGPAARKMFLNRIRIESESNRRRAAELEALSPARLFFEHESRDAYNRWMRQSREFLREAKLRPASVTIHAAEGLASQAVPSHFVGDLRLMREASRIRDAFLRDFLKGKARRLNKESLASNLRKRSAKEARAIAEVIKQDLAGGKAGEHYAFIAGAEHFRHVVPELKRMLSGKVEVRKLPSRAAS